MQSSHYSGMCCSGAFKSKNTGIMLLVMRERLNLAKTKMFFQFLQQVLTSNF